MAKVVKGDRLMAKAGDRLMAKAVKGDRLMAWLRLLRVIG
jgi:hypothetical protein